MGQFLLRRIREAGVTHLFGVPGDYNLEFMQQLEEDGSLAWIGCCNELNAAYAADGYARLHGLAVLVVTHGVGALSALNGLAGACCEHVPIVCVCGAPPLRAADRRLMMHHTLADGGTDHFLRVFAELTAAQGQLRPHNAAAEIDRLVLTAWRRKLPVYLELPSDVTYLDVDVPSAPLELTMPASDPERLDACARAIAGRLSAARSPAVLLDLDAERFRVGDEIMALAEKRQLPVATINTCKGIINETSPRFVGTYAGASSPPAARRAVEESDCLLAVGYRRTDSSSGFFSDAVPADAIHLGGFSADVGPDNFQGVTLKEVLRAVTHVLPTTAASVPTSTPAPKASDRPPAAVAAFPDDAGKLTQTAFWQAVQGFLREGDVLIAEDGTSSAGGGALALPPRCTFITQAIWGSIGYSLGSLLGTLIASPERRHLLFIGDGSFQLTAQELSTMLRHGLKPWIFLINNGGYTIERTILGRRARYNDVADWRYAELPGVFYREPRATSRVVATVKEFRAALALPHESLMFVEAVMDSEDSPASLVKAGHASADLDYGPRGPQHAPNAQIKPTG